MQLDETPAFAGPIPGENYTSDVRNYPWHRPPDFVQIDEAIDFITEQLTDEEMGFKMMNLVEAGLTLATATDFYLTIGISEGRWTPDFAILLAGPVCRILEIMSKSYEIEYDLGIESNKPTITAAFAREMAANPDRAEEAAQAVSDASQDIKDEAATQAPGGLMRPLSEAPVAPEDDQLAMLGYGAEPTADEMPPEELY